VIAGALVALAIAVPSHAQGNSGGKKPGKGPTRPPSSGTVTPQATSGGSVLATTMPFAWLDDASVMESGNVWVAVSMARWQGSGLSQTIVPVVDTAIGLTPRVQLGASVPRVAAAGTMFQHQDRRAQRRCAAVKVRLGRHWVLTGDARAGRGVGRASQRADRSRELSDLRQHRLFLAGHLVRWSGNRPGGERPDRDIDLVQPRLGDVTRVISWNAEPGAAEPE
jgi:hypothetical protein